jgi:CRISPR-associated protein (TIGR03986 family)
MNPRHKNPTQSHRKARAPYNFVPLPEKVVPAEPPPDQDNYHLDRRTGHIRCTLTTLSPLYTRTTLNPDFFRNWSDKTREMMNDDNARREHAQFFHLDDAQRPVIPGSSLRGMLRSLVEIAGYGKIQWVADTPLAFRAVADTTSLGAYYKETLPTTAIRAGYFVRDGAEWRIRPAKPIEGAAFARIRRDMIRTIRSSLPAWPNSKDPCRNAGVIYVQTRPSQTGPPIVSSASPTPDDPSRSKAVLVTTGDIPRKRNEFVFGLPDDRAEPVEVPEELLHAYRDQMTDQQRHILGNQEGVLRKSQPVFYFVDNGSLKFFGHCMMFRLPYSQTPRKLVPPALRTDASDDLAESIFGSAKDSQARAGRAFFSDARLESAASGVWLSQEPITPKILSSPKPTTFQHYLTQEHPDNKNQLHHYDSQPPHETVIRGHKLYWHRGSAKQENIRESDEVGWSNDTQHTAIKPVRAGVTFRFEIRFENLSEVELGALLWALTPPGEPGKQYHHKLGMGKPLGMGSVKIATDLYLSNRRHRYSRLFDGQGWLQAESHEPNMQQVIDSFETYVLQQMDPGERAGATSLKDVHRIKMLLKLLEWPGPNPSTTGYMDIAGPKGNEYKDRPVLPGALHVH